MWFFALISLFSALHFSALEPRAQTTVRIGVPASQTSAIPIHIGAQRGIFAKYGLRGETIVIPSGRVNPKYRPPRAERRKADGRPTAASRQSGR